MVDIEVQSTLFYEACPRGTFFPSFWSNINLIMHPGLRNYAEAPTAHLEGTSELHFQREEVL